MELVVAKEIMDFKLKHTPIPDAKIPPVQNEDTLRAKGIARVSHKAAARPAALQQGRKDSATILPLFPLPEDGILEIQEQTLFDREDVEMEEEPEGQAMDSGFDWDDEGNLWATSNARDNLDPDHDNRPDDPLLFIPAGTEAGRLNYGYPFCHWCVQP